MKFNSLPITILILILIFFSMCKTNKKEEENSEIKTAINTSYKMLPADQQEVVNIVTHWNEMHDSLLVDSLDIYYSNTVQFFKKNVSKKTVIDTKKYKIKHAKTYRQRIIGRVGIYPSDTGDYKCEFLKLVTVNGKPNVYHAYLVFKKMQDSTWKIIVESDKEADLRPEYISLFEKFKESESISSGDFNGDGTKEDLIVQKPARDTSGKYLSVETKISFTNIDLPEIIIPNCIGVNVLNENDVDGDGSDDFSIVIKTPSGDVGDVILYSFKRGAWQELTKFKAPESEVFGSRQNLIEFAGSGSIKYRTIEKTTDNRDSLVIKTISTW
jgi:hypothetical protein